MGKLKVILSIALSCMIGISAFGQGTDTSSQMTYVIKTDYEPKLTSANKVMTAPNIREITSTNPSFEYDLPNFAYKVLPTYHPAKAISLKSEIDEPLFGNYFRLGGTPMYLTTLGEFRVHSVRNKKYNYGVSGTHMSSNAGDPAHADFSDNTVSVMGSKIGNKGELTGKLNYERHVIHYYGYPDSFEFDKVNINQIYNDFNGSALYDRGYNTKKIGSQLGFNFYTFGTHGRRRENDFMGTLKTRIKLPKHQAVDINAAVDYTNIIDTAVQALNRTFIRVSPKYTFRYKKVDIGIGINTVTTIDTIDNPGAKFQLFPDVEVKHFFVKDRVLGYAEINGDVHKNSNRELVYLNPFMSNNTEIRNTVRAFNFETGIKGVLAKKFDFLIGFQVSADNNLPLFLTDSTPTRSFGVVYDDVTTTAVKTGLGFRLEERLFVQAAGTFYTYKTQNQAEAWQLPAFDADVNVRYTLAEKLNIRFQMYAYGNRFQLDQFSETKEQVELKPMIDLNVMADYRYKKNISFFLNANNVSGTRYQKWYAYPSFGFNLLAGITFSL